MNEQILNDGQKEEMVKLIDTLIELTYLSKYNKYFMTFIIPVNNQEIGCHMRANGCIKCIKFNNLSKYDCSLCWFNWYISENSLGLFPVVLNNDIKSFFGNDLMEIKKRDSFSCYRLLFKANKGKDKQILIDTFSGMKTYLTL